MSEHKKASFSFRHFIVPSFSYNRVQTKNSELDLVFDTEGKYFKDKGVFQLTLKVEGLTNNEDKTQVIKIISIGDFVFSEKLDIKEIPEYFYSNAIAIMFPYVRAFISTLTLQANTGVLMLDTLNLSGLKENLKQQTTLG